MKRKTLALLLTATCVVSLSACGGASNNSSNAEVAIETQSEAASVEETVESENSDDVADASSDMVKYESPLGYTVEYYGQMFNLTSDETSDVFEFCGDGVELEAPIYVAIQLYTDMDAETVANGVALQSGQDGVTVDDTTFGEGIEAKYVSYQEEAEGLTWYMTFFAVPKGDGCLLLEVGEYIGYEGQEMVDGNIELLIDSFIPSED
jgi:hypothetical protein